MLHLVQDDSRLQKMHPKSQQGRSQDFAIGGVQNPSSEHEQKKRPTEKTEQDKILDRLMFAIRHEVEIVVDGGEPTEESISRRIDMKRLLPNRSQDAHQYSKDDYSAVIFDAVNTVTGDPDLQVNRKLYDGCQHVSFLLQK